jgi:hypothetical protein
MREMWFEYWWILPTLSYIILLVVLGRHGKCQTANKLVLLATCAIILYLPAMHAPLSYFTATAVVVYLLLSSGSIFKTEISPRPSGR